MRKLLLSAFLVASFGMNAQTVLFEDSFDTYADFAIANVGAWTLTDVDMRPTYGVEQGNPAVSVTFPNSQSPMAFIVMNPTMSTPPLGANWVGHTGLKSMVAMASIPASGVVNNDWLISPQIQLGTSGNQLTFWAKAITAAYPERFRVGISTTGTAPSDFTIITPSPGVTPTTVWAQYTYALDAYQGQNVYIAINCISNDAFAFFVDDFKVTATTLATEDFFKANFAVYPNPATDVLNIAANNGVSITKAIITDINGRVISQQNLDGVSQAGINVANLAKGVYFISVESASGKGTTKFLKN